ncbi:MAG: LCP family protein [Syntrophomonadaceae bacterium]|nr:LCP family protein [Syntrophomonadaceae bacterium]
MKIDVKALKDKLLGALRPAADDSGAQPIGGADTAKDRKTMYRNILVGALIFMLCMGGGILGMRALFGEPPVPADEPEPTEEIIEGERTNILFLGMDARAGETASRADTIILASIDPELKRAAMISIPRDTRVTINGDPDQKVSFGNVYGGTELTVKLVENMMNEKIDYYVQLDFEGFEQIIDVLGGVTIDVEARKYKPEEGIDIEPGLQKLNGHDALGYVRYRDYNMGDIERTTVQQKFIQALKDEVLQTKTIVKLPSLARQVYSLSDTNMTTADMLAMSKWVSLFEGDTLIAQTLPGHFLDVRDENGILLNSFWQTDDEVNGNLLEQLMAGETVPMLLPASEADSLIVVPSEQPAEEAYQVDIPVLEEDDETVSPQDTDLDGETGDDYDSEAGGEQPPAADERPIDIPPLDQDAEPPSPESPVTAEPPVIPETLSPFERPSGGPPADSGI